jgi:DNA-binding NtrC family response regulator
MMIKILVATHEPDQRKLLELILTRVGYHCLFAENFREVVAILQSSPVDLLFLRSVLVNNRRESETVEPELHKIGVIWSVKESHVAEIERASPAFVDKYIRIPLMFTIPIRMRF